MDRVNRLGDGIAMRAVVGDACLQSVLRDEAGGLVGMRKSGVQQPVSLGEGWRGRVGDRGRFQSCDFCTLICSMHALEWGLFCYLRCRIDDWF
jgi:hypothetical protein